MSVGEFDSLLSQTGALDPDEAIASISIESRDARRAQRQKQRLDDEQQERDDRAGEPDDVVAEREAIREKEDARDAGNKDTGGSSGSTSPTQTSAVSGPEPRPQREEPDASDEPDDDGDEEEEEADLDPEPEPEPDAEPEPEEEPVAPVVTKPETPEPEPDVAPSQPRQGTKPAVWKEGERFSYGVGPVDDQNKSTEMKLSRFPKSLVSALRSMIGGHLGDAFAKEASSNQLVTAFIAARLGVTTDADANTSRLITAFRELEPQMDVLSRSMAAMEAQMDSLAKSNRGLVKRLSAVEDITASAELATSFFIADRIGMISTSEMTIEKAEISQPKALAMRDKIREQAKVEQDRQRRDEGTSY